MTKNLADFIEYLNDFLQETGMSKNALSRASGVSQAQISEWSHGKGVFFTEKARKVQIYIENYRNSHQRIPAPIVEAIIPMLNGKRKRVREIEAVLKSLHKVYGVD